MLNTLMLENFRNHTKLQINLDEHITSIIGPSDAGKTNIVRGLRWITHNRPLTKGMIQIGKNKCRVGIKADGHTIVRVRSKNENYYVLDKKKYHAIKTGVPEPVSDVLNIGDLNYQSQHDSPFWLNDSDAQVSKYLNQIVNLGAIDAVLATVGSEVRSAKATIEVSERRLAEAKQRKKDLSWIIQAEAEFAEIERLQNEASALTQQASAIRQLISTRAEYQAAKSSADGAIALASAALRAGRKAMRSAGRVEAIRKVLAAIKQKEQEQCQLDQEIQKLERKLQQGLKGKCPVCGGKLPT